MSPEPAATDEQTSREVGRRSPRLLYFGRAVWIANVAALLSLVAWILGDGRFSHAALQVRAVFAGAFGGTVNLASFADQTWFRVELLCGIVLIAFLSGIGIFLALFVGTSSHRTLRAWLAFTFLVAAWLTLLVGWRELAWQGQRLRMRADLAAFEAVAESLRTDWPTRDGQRPGLGNFMAYPQGQPRMLMMLTSDTDPAISAVERWDSGSLGFELQGDETGAWLEWHPAGSTPRGFIGGLEDEYEFGRASALGNGWYLVRYR